MAEFSNIRGEGLICVPPRLQSRDQAGLVPLAIMQLERRRHDSEPHSSIAANALPSIRHPASRRSTLLLNIRCGTRMHMDTLNRNIENVQRSESRQERHKLCENFRLLPGTKNADPRHAQSPPAGQVQLSQLTQSLSGKLAAHDIQGAPDRAGQPAGATSHPRKLLAMAHSRFEVACFTRCLDETR